MTRTMGDLEKMRLLASERDFLSSFEEEMAPQPKIKPHRPIASARASRQGSSPLRGAPLVPRSASLTAALASAPVLSWGACAPRRPNRRRLGVRPMKIFGTTIRLNLLEEPMTGYNI